MAKVLVTYYSKSGNTEAMAKILAAAAKAAGANVVTKRAEETKNDDLTKADAIAFGSPDYFSYPAGYVKAVFDEALSVKAALTGKPGACFLSHGGGGRAKDPFDNLAKAVGLKLVADCVLSEGAPSADAKAELENAAAALVAAIKK
jgi:multimeric flavodoxin WrbA